MELSSIKGIYKATTIGNLELGTCVIVICDINPEPFSPLIRVEKTRRK